MRTGYNAGLGQAKCAFGNTLDRWGTMGRGTHGWFWNRKHFAVCPERSPGLAGVERGTGSDGIVQAVSGRRLHLCGKCGIIVRKSMRRLVPYVAWAAWLRSLDALGPKAARRLGPGSLALPASTANQMLQAYRAMGLLRAEDEVTDDLRLLVEHPEGRPVLMAQVLARTYSELADSSQKRINGEDVRRYFRALPMSEATQRKAELFFQNAAAYAGFAIESVEPGRDAQVEPVTAVHSMRVALRSNGVIDISLRFDPFRISADDRHFLFELIDRLKSYEDDVLEQKRQEDWAESDEVPF